MNHPGGIKIAYVVPGIGLSQSEVERRRTIANSVVSDKTTVDIVTVRAGPLTIESAVEEAFAAISYLGELPKLEAAYDSFVIGCFGDPGVRAARELVDKLVVGPAEASLHVASMIADEFSIVTPLHSLVPMTKHLVRVYGFEERVRAVIPIELPVASFVERREEAVGELVEQLRREPASVKGDAVILGCMSMGFALVDEVVGEDLGVPILNPVKISLRVAEALAALKMNHSRRSYPKANMEKLKHLLEVG